MGRARKKRQSMNKQEELNGRLMRAAKSGDLSALIQALEDGADARAQDSWALVGAASYGHGECVRLLMPVSDAKAQDSLALRWAAAGGQADCVRLLIPASDPLAKGSHALRWAAAFGQAECVASLLPASDPLAVGDEGLDAAASARKEGHMEVAGMIEAFIEAGALSGCVQAAKMNPRAKSSL
jgi:hypothetical protein